MHPALFLARVKVACNATTLSNFIICLVALKKQQYAGFQLHFRINRWLGIILLFFSRLTDDDD